MTQHVMLLHVADLLYTQMVGCTRRRRQTGAHVIRSSTVDLCAPSSTTRTGSTVLSSLWVVANERIGAVGLPAVTNQFATRDDVYDVIIIDALAAATHDAVKIVSSCYVIAAGAPLCCRLNGVTMRPLSPRRPITGRLGTRHLSNTPFQR